MDKRVRVIINKILDIIIKLLMYFTFIIIGFFIGIVFCSFEENNEYNPEKTHYMLEHENKYQYCPYCGKLLVEEEKSN